MCFDSVNLQGTGAAQKRTGGERERYGKRKSRVRKAGVSDLPILPSSPLPLPCMQTLPTYLV